MVVVPVYEIDVFGNLFSDLFGYLRIETVIISVKGEVIEHISPHAAMVTVFFRDLKHAREVAVDDVETVFVSVLVEVFPEPDHPRFVHADVYFARIERARKLAEHILYERVRLFFPAKEDIVAVAYGSIVVPAEYRVEMRERLHAGHEQNAETVRIRVELFEFFFGVCAAQIPEHRLSFDFVRIFNIKHQPVVTAGGEHAQ